MTTIGILVFPGVQAIDAIGPADMLAMLPSARVLIVAASPVPVRSSAGPCLVPDATFTDCPPLDVICVPGGAGIDAAMQDAATIAFVAERAAAARYVTSVCTGALLLGAAGLLTGRRATTHWRSLDLLARFGATPVAERVVRDGRLVTGGGATAGLDFGLSLAAEIAGPEVAQAIQLGLEYAPAPLFAAGLPATAPPAVLATAIERTATLHLRREAIVRAIVGDDAG